MARTIPSGTFVHSPGLPQPRRASFVPHALSPVLENYSIHSGPTSMGQHFLPVCQQPVRPLVSPMTGAGVDSLAGHRGGDGVTGSLILESVTYPMSSTFPKDGASALGTMGDGGGG